MSQVISFRLDPDNPREAMALEFLRNRLVKGFRLREVITDALIQLEKPGSQLVESSPISYELLSRLTEVLEVIEKTEFRYTKPDLKDKFDQSKKELDEVLIASIRKSVKCGLKIDE